MENFPDRFSEERGSFFWDLDFQRPLQDEPGNIARQLAKVAREYYEGNSREDKEIESGNATLAIFPSEHPLGYAFVLRTSGDNDSGGWLGEIYPPSIRLALAEKIAKTKPLLRSSNIGGFYSSTTFGHGSVERE